MSVNRCFVTKTRFLEPESIDQAFIKGWKVHCFKDSVSFCHCTYVLRISGYSSFLIRNLPTNTTIFLRGLLLCGKSRS